MKKECELRVMLANKQAELVNRVREDNSNITAWVEEQILQTKIDLLKDILETEDNSCY